MTFSPGDAIIFTPGEVREGKPGRRGEFVRVLDHPDTTGPIVVVHLQGDPFNVCVYAKQIKPTDKENNMPTATAKPKAKDLRRQAKALGVEGWEDMSLDELIEAVGDAEEAEATPRRSTKKAVAKKSTTRRAAVEDDDDDEDEEDDEDEDVEDDEDEDDEDEDEAPAPRRAKKASASKKATPAKKATATKTAAKKSAPAKKATAKKAAPAKRAAAAAEENENGNPYAAGTNLYWMAEALIKGGKVSTLVKNLRKKVEIKPRSREYDEDSLNAELQRRLIIVSQHLRNEHGFEMEKEGRGWDAVIRCYKED